jgi:hypothetical protein
VVNLPNGLTAGSTGRTVLRTSLRVAGQPGVMSIGISQNLLKGPQIPTLRLPQKKPASERSWHTN